MHIGQRQFLELVPILQREHIFHVEHLSEEQAKVEKNRKNAIRIDNVMDLVNDLGIPVFNTKKE